MLPARKNRLFELLFENYTRNLIERRFHGLRVAGLDRLTVQHKNTPLVLYANHSSWWDALVVFALGRKCKLDQFAMMEERQLRQYKFFRWLGAFSVVRESPRAAVRSIEYAAQLLAERERALWIFPQGRTLPNDVRPLALYTGAARIIERTKRAIAVPVALRYEHMDDFRPEIFVRIGEPQLIIPGANFNSKQFTREMEARLTSTLDAIRSDILRFDFADYTEVIAPH